MIEDISPQTAIRLLLLGSSRDQTETIEASLRNGGLAVHCTQILEMDDLEDKLILQAFDILICCSFDTKIDVLRTLELLAERSLDLPTLILFITQQADHAELLQFMRKGARDLIEKDDLERLQLAIAREIGDLERRRELHGLRRRILVSEQRCLDLVEGSREAIAFFQDGMHVHANPAYLQLFGFQNQEDVEALPLLDIVDKSQHKALRAALKSIENSQEHQPANLAVTCKHQDGSSLNLSIFIIKVELDGEPSLQVTVRNHVPDIIKQKSQSLNIDIKPIIKEESANTITKEQIPESVPLTVPALTIPDERDNADNRLLQLLDRALSHNKFQLLYQSIVNLHGSGTRENYTVAVQFLDERNREIPQEIFSDLTKRYEKQSKVDRWVIRHAIAALSAQRQEGHRTGLFITLSEPSILDKNLLLWIVECLNEYDARGSWIAFEISEKYARDNVQVMVKLIEGLKTIKCQVAIGQFGLLPNAEQLLNQLDIDYVKLAPSLLQNLHIDQQKQDELSQLNEVLQRHNIKTIATAVDDGNSLSILWNLGVTFIQGNFPHEPSPTIDLLPS